jgi:excisionase family DNA binding protein
MTSSTVDLKLFTLEEAAELLHVTESWYMRQLRNRQLPGRKVARKWMLTRSDIEAAIEQMASPAIVAKPDPAGLTRTSRRRLSRHGGAGAA